MKILIRTEIIIGKTAALDMEDMPGEGVHGQQGWDRATDKTSEDADNQYQAGKEGAGKGSEDRVSTEFKKKQVGHTSLKSKKDD